MDVRAECAEERDRLSMTLEEQDGSSMDTKGTEQSGIFIEFFFFLKVFYYVYCSAACIPAASRGHQVSSL